MIFIDMDGVLANFQARIEEITGLLYEHEWKEKWSKIYGVYPEGKGFYASIRPMHDAQELLDYFPDAHILSSAGIEKVKWMRNTFSILSNRVHIVHSAEEKADYVKGTCDVLIDDHEYCINPWKAKGGIGILHKSTKETIRKYEHIFNRTRYG